MASPYYTKTQVDVKIDGLEEQIANIADGTAGKAYPNLTTAMAVTPLPSDGVIFTIDEDNETEAGVYAYDSNEVNGYRFVRELGANGKVEEGDKRAVSGGEVYNFTSQVIKKGPQLFDKKTAQIELGTLRDTDGILRSSNHNFRVRIPNSILKVGETYALKTPLRTSTSSAKVSFFNSSNSVIDFIPSVTNTTDRDVVFTVPENTEYTYLQLGQLFDANTYPLRDNEVVNEVMLNEGEEPLPFEPFRYVVNPESIPEYPEVLEVINKIEPVSDELVNLANKEILVMAPGKNLIDESIIDFTKRYSPGNLRISNSGNTIYIATSYIKVKGGEFYAFNAETFSGGGYFENIGDINAVEGITPEIPVDGVGFTFQVPLEYDGYYVVLNLTRTGTSGTTLSKDFQLEIGEQVTEYEPYEEVEQFNPDYLINNNNTPAPIPTGTLLDKLTDVDNITKLNHNKLPNFFKSCRLKNKDVVVAMTGTSLTARSIEHCTEHPLANERPPLFHSMNTATHIWDAIKWDSQYYRRYDFPNYFLEEGTWNTDSNRPEWDDGPYRSGLTRYSDDITSSVEFEIPINAFQFNFIYRADTLGTEDAVIEILEGDGLVEVYDNDDDTWKEANGFSFSQKTAEVTLPTVTFPDAASGNDVTRSNYKVAGNTIYQKRLKMRCKSGLIDSREEIKNVRISRTTGRLSYWGVEWSSREFMITFINASRGSHTPTFTNANSLAHYFDNEIVSFKPDLILTENPIHNAGAARQPITTYSTNYWGDITNDFFFGENPLSLKTRLENAGIYDVEYLIFTSSIAWNFNGINEDGSLKMGVDKDGVEYTALESYSMAHQYLLDNYPDVLSINSTNYWVKSGFDVYGDLRTATEGSGKAGLTFTNEGSHWNNTGSKIIAKTIIPYLNFEM